MRFVCGALAFALLMVAAACGGGSAPPVTMLNSTTHDQFFPIAAGSKHALGSDYPAISCNSCHGSGASFTQFDCLSCHQHRDQTALGLAHHGLSQYAYNSASCYSCHPRGTASGAAPSGTVSDPARDVSVTAQIPSYVDTSISRMSPQTEILPMPMDHSSAHLEAAAFASCGNCHVNAATGAYYPGNLHSSLANLNLAQPSGCVECHAESKPTGFVGPIATNPTRTPPSGEMKHDAVLWSNGVPTAAAAVAQDCGVCHVPPAMSMPATWGTNRGGKTPALFHASLMTADLPQPTSCVDCHANSRPNGVVTIPATKVQFDHAIAAALADCASCHQGSSAAAQWSSWAGGKFHLPGDATPASCLPCHAGERPTTTSTWMSTTYGSSPFDDVTNAQGITHGAGQDCAVCHHGPGTGAWGGTQNWIGGYFAHGATTMSGQTCIACHSTQRPDLQAWTTPAAMASLLNFDHSINGTGDCIGCHQATAAAAVYQYYFKPGTQTLPGGDWQGGASYPGATLIGSPSQSVTVTEIDLHRSGSRNLITSTTSTSVTLLNEMLHVSSAIAPQLSPGPAGNPDEASCWRCHTHDGAGNVTSFANGQFHSALTFYSSTPGGTPTPLPQPAQCLDCHARMLRPGGIVEKAASDLQPMDHTALFTSAVTIGGASVNGVAGIECAVCHKSPGNTWADGTFHANIGAAVPQDCTTCHYPLMADTALSDVSSGVDFTMKHASSQLIFQSCQVCHADALSNSGNTPIASTSWQPGIFHPSLASQPSACLGCHDVSEPAANTATQSSVTYDLPVGGTSTNAAQWMNHGSPSVAGKDCFICHEADAMTSGSAWSKSDSFHGPVANPSSCGGCHGLSNGGGPEAGTNNNLPVGLTNSSTVTSAAADSATGVPPGTLDQITHTDINVSNHDCNFCHTQQGVSIDPGVQGREWAQAAFHANFTSTNLVVDGTTGRCSNCHMNVKPGADFALFDHSGFSATSQDCGMCHSWPGTGTPTDPNWLGASAAPAVVTLIGGTSGTSNPVTFAHPRPATYTSCAQCHEGTNYSTIIDFNHDGLTSDVTINGVTPPTMPNLGTSIYDPATNPTFCVACHNSGSPSVRPGLSSTITADTTSGSTTVTTASTSALTLGMTIEGMGIPKTTTTTPLTVTITAIPSATSLTISTAANATTIGTALTVTHMSIRQASIGNHGGSTSGQDCTSCHYRGGRERLTPPTPGVFGTGTISGN